MSAGCEAIEDLLADFGAGVGFHSMTEFARNWTAEILAEAPLIAPARQYVWPMRIAGEEDALARGALRLMVRPASGGQYLVTCALGFAIPPCRRGSLPVECG